MRYREAKKLGSELSVLGLGCMRFPFGQEASNRLMQAALDAGINYFDTAYVYAGNEVVVGNFLAQGHRDEVMLATKLPHYLCKSSDDFDRIFEEELQRLQTDHIDCYLVHMLSTPDQWERLVGLGIEEWIDRRKQAGQIRHIGFSFHGGCEHFKQLVDAYDWEFTQIQLNYYDAHAQAGLEGLRYAAAAGLPVIVMEPLRGGTLATGLSDAAKAIFEGAGPSMTPAQWGLQWLLNLPEVTCVLSGMSDANQVAENAAVADLVRPATLSDSTLSVYDTVVTALHGEGAIGCTGCRYCMPCPQGVDIPTVFNAYNSGLAHGWLKGEYEYMQVTSLGGVTTGAGRCADCGACEAKCPQQLPIPDLVDRIAARYEGVPYKLAVAVKRKVMNQE